MSKIKIKNFGPIKEGYQDNDGWMDVKKVTVFIGNQGSGKSSVAKLISTFTWIEKALTRGDYNIKEFTNNNKFRKTYCGYHRIENYFYNLKKQDNAEVEYEGNSYSMKYQNGKLEIEETSKGKYVLPQIMYVPAERNFISTIRVPKLIKLASSSIVELITEFDNAKDEIKEPLQLPINDAFLEFDRQHNILYVSGKDYRVRLTEASSGFQSFVPLFLVSRYLANSIKQVESKKEGMSSDEMNRYKKDIALIWENENMTDEQKRIALSTLSAKFNKSAFINIVEEPEQNLFPGSQRHILNSLLEFVNLNEGNKLIITTHSPYIINYLSIAIQGKYLFSKINSNSKELYNRLNNIVPVKTLVSDAEVAIYQLEEKDGNIKKLPDFEGIPSDKNELNKMLGEGNQLFDSLLEIEEEL